MLHLVIHTTKMKAACTEAKNEGGFYMLYCCYGNLLLTLLVHQWHHDTNIVV